MATIKLYLDKRSSAPGKQSPMKISISFKGRNALFSTGIKLHAGQWDERSCKVVHTPMKQGLNSALGRMKIAWETELLKLSADGEIGKVRTAAELRDLIACRLYPDKFASRESSLLFVSRFVKFAGLRRTAGNRDAYMRTLTMIRKFDPDVGTKSFEDVDKAWLTEFDRFLAKTERSANSRAFHMRNIRAVFNDALDDEITAAYPFRKFKILQQPTRKRSLTVEQLRTLSTYPCEGYQAPYRDMFMLMFMLIGINGADLFAARPDAVVDGRLEYVRAKTHKPYSIKVEPEAAALLERFRGREHLVWVSDVYASHKDYLHRMGVALKQIGPVERHGLGGKKMRQPLFPNISQYWCRHTWATIAASLDIPKETIAAALGHGGNTVTDIYIDFDRRKVDEANRRVIDWVLYGKRE